MKTIYYLSDSISNQPFYVGATNNLDKRMYKHMNEAKLLKRRCRRTLYMAKLISDGVRISMNPLEVVTNEQRQFWEHHYISLFRSWGFDLVNQVPYAIRRKHKPESIELMRKNRAGKKGIVGRKRTDQEKEHLRKINLGKRHTEESKKKMSLGQLRRYGKIP